MLSKSKLVVAGVLFLLASVVLNQAVSAAVPSTFLTSGTTRYAFVSTATVTSTTSTSFVNLSGLSTTIAIPAGKTADVFILFCGDTMTESYTLVRALVGGNRASPVEMQVREPPADPLGGGETGCANFLKKDVPAGTQTVSMQWRGAGAFPGSQQQMFDRSMVVIANIH
jgi:hypothetical protein